MQCAFLTNTAWGLHNIHYAKYAARCSDFDASTYGVNFGSAGLTLVVRPTSSFCSGSARLSARSWHYRGKYPQRNVRCHDGPNNTIPIPFRGLGKP